MLQVFPEGRILSKREREGESERGDYENVSHDDLEPQLYDRQWRWLPAAGLGGAMLLAAVLVVASRRPGVSVSPEGHFKFEGGAMPLMQKWLPTDPAAVLPYDQWVKAWHVKVGHLTDVVYHTYSHHPQFVQDLNSMTGFLQWQLAHNCPKQVEGFDVVSHDAHHFPVLSNIPSPGQCQKLCTETQNCNSWTWAKLGDFKHDCWRKNLDGKYRFAENSHVVAGRACDRQEQGYWWPHSDADLYDFPVNVVKSKAVTVQTPLCAKKTSRQECISPMERSILPWPLNFLHKQKQGSCCAPVELKKEAMCGSGATPMRTGHSCSGFEAADYECCPHEYVLGKSVGSNPEKSSMHCVILFRAWSYEQQLVALQHESQAGIFACDSYALYSNQLVELKPGVVTRRVHSAMMCELGGEFITALNLGIFLAFYRQVILDQDFMKAAWVIKVDPDTVWSPARLRPMLEHLSWGLSGDGIYLNNCQDGLHGPVEVFSSGAFLALGQNAKSCAAGMNGKECIEDCEGVWSQTKVCNGPCTEWWGEDIWADQCLWRFTKAKRVLIKTLLQEQHCKPHVKDWRSCRDTTTVAFHPFKSADDFQACLREMSYHDGGFRTLLES